MELYFLSLNDVLEIHADQIKRFGGKIGIRDQGLLISVISQPFTMFDGQYLHSSIYDKAAAYLFHICQNHPFIDGNKRVALASMLIFLDLTEKRIRLLKTIKNQNPTSIYQLAKLLQRDHKNTKNDVEMLTELGLIEIEQQIKGRRTRKPLVKYNKLVVGIDL